MAEPIRNPASVLAALKGACEAHPDQRVMQVVVNALGEDPFYVEDAEAVEALVAYAMAPNSPRTDQTGDTDGD